MTLTELIIASRRGRELTPYQKWCLEGIEQKGKYHIDVNRERGTATIYKKKSNKKN